MILPGHHNSCRACFYSEFPGKVQKRQPGLMHTLLKHWKRLQKEVNGGVAGTPVRHGPTCSHPGLHTTALRALSDPDSCLPGMVVRAEVLLFIAGGVSQYFPPNQSPSYSSIEPSVGVRVKEGL